MKKFIIIFISIVSFFIFDISFKEESSREYAKQKSVFDNIIQNTDYKEVSLSVIVENEEKQVFLDSLISFLDNENYTACIGISENITNFNKRDDYYFYTKDSNLTENMYVIKEDKLIDFSSDTLEYYTSDLNNENSSSHIVFLDSTYNEAYNNILYVHPLKQLIRSKRFEIQDEYRISFYVNDVKEFENKLQNSELNDFTVQDGLIPPEEEEHDNTDFISIISVRVIFIIFLAIILLAVGNVIKLKKEIIIRKVHGMSNLYITKKIFLKELIVLLLIYIITQIGCYFLYIGNFYNNSIDFIKYLMRYLLVLLGTIIIIFGILYLLIRSFNDITFIRKEKVDRRIVILNAVLKTIAILILMVPTITHTSRIIEDTQIYSHLTQNKDNFEKQVYIQSIYVGSDPSKFDIYRKEILEYFNDNGGFYQNFEYEEMRNFDESKEKLNYPVLEVNLNFLRDYELYDENGDKIIIENLDDRTLLVPFKYKEENLADFDYADKIIIQNGNTFTRKDIPSDIKSFQLNNPVIYVYSSYPKDARLGSFFCMLPINDDNDIKMLDEFLKDNNLEDSVHFKEYLDDYNIVEYYVRSQLIESLTFLVIQFLVIMIFLYENTYLNISQEKKLYAIKYLHGHSYFERYFNIFIINAIVYFILLFAGAFIFNLTIVEVLSYIGIIFIFEMIITNLIIKYFEKKYFVRSLKGE